MDDLRSTQDLLTAGWGQTEKYAESPQLMFGIVRTVAVSDCAERHQALPEILNRKLNRGVTDEMYCAIGEQGNNTSDFVDSCQGDSGGPLQMEYQGNVFLVGIVSTGHGCGSSLPALYTRVSYYFDWINEKVTQLKETASA
ncbi:CLIP domain-containing serine protease C9-like [Anopheles cruzii]|uniref:CLIP domain-containing serine protease C9-like n=1 Tax=Anopheles cruzii TaxID=68878 RepID=UPI0022EC65C9|nr:CLIP domain-containing serine protease C9-like [Anopheles cruzii]